VTFIGEAFERLGFRACSQAPDGEDLGEGPGTMTNFKTGDIVTLKSGGIKMTVHSVKAQGVVCFWCSGLNLMKETFPPDMLVNTASAETPGGDGNAPQKPPQPWASIVPTTNP
jgi:uncharacterized protein YodC (DUF2158 family)